MSSMIGCPCCNSSLTRTHWASRIDFSFAFVVLPQEIERTISGGPWAFTRSTKSRSFVRMTALFSLAFWKISMSFALRKSSLSAEKASTSNCCSFPQSKKIDQNTLPGSHELHCFSYRCTRAEPPAATPSTSLIVAIVVSPG